MRPEYDLIVIGGGAAGLVAAGIGAVLGAKTALIEEQRLGGECTWTGCVPSKTLLRAARLVQEAREASRFGLTNSELPVDFARLMEHVRSVRQHIYDEADAPPNLEKLGIEIVPNRAQFTGPHTVDIGSRRLTARAFIIATGSRPRTPKFNGPVLTNETLFELTEQPKRLIVLGAGPAGIEMAQAFARLGSAVTVIAPTPVILPRDDQELATLLLGQLRAEGIEFRLSRRAVDAREHRVQLDDGSWLEADAIYAAIGRRPSIESLNLQAAGVRTTDKGIPVDAHCRTNQHHIYAAGDVIGQHQFTHMAEHTAKIAATNAILRVPARMDSEHIAWCTFTDPELAHLGEVADGKHRIYRFPFRKLDRAITEGATEGLVKVRSDRSGRIRGVSILGTNAGEMIAEWAVAMKGGLKLRDLADTIHPYPTYALGNRRAADQWYTGKLGTPVLAVLGKLLGYRGERRKPADL